MPIRLVDSINLISSKINKACSEELNAILPGKKYRIMSIAKRLASNWIISQPEMDSLSGGFLSGAFGLYSGTEAQAVNSIKNSVEQSIEVNVNTVSNSLHKGGITINFQPSTFTNLLSLSEGHVSYSGGDLHWLQWLLEQGDAMIIVNYRYYPESGMGRSNKGFMKKTGTFRVPPQFSGTVDNNFITRALTGPVQQKELNREIINIIKS